MIRKDLTVTVESIEEGTTLVLKTLSGVGKDKVLISGDPAAYDIKEVKEALKEIESFTKEEVVEEAGYPLP